MPDCKKCTNNFPNRLVVNGKVRNTQRRKYCLDCSPFGLRNRRKLHITALLPKGFLRESILTIQCHSCPRTYEVAPHQKIIGKTCPACHVAKRRKERKELFVKMLGGHCLLCKYSRCIRALQFHHVDQATKSFEISGSECRRLAVVLEELKKCVLLCGNCHDEVHAFNIDMTFYLRVDDVRRAA
jgi:hypothetical protein